MTTTVLAVRSRLYRHTAAGACAALAMTAVAATAPAQAAARATGHGRARAAAATPRGREWAAFAYYPPKNELVLFGGRRPGTIFGDTWTRTGATWTLHNPTRSPSARTGASMVFDPATSQLLLFGGSATTGTGFSNQTWTWNGSNWTQLHPATSPPGREDQQMAYDAATKTVILFAGFHGTGYWDDTWSWNGTTWTQLNPATSPSGRDSAAFIYDPATSQMILFGGFRGTGFAPGDTWSWNGTTWTPLSPAALAGHRRLCPAGRLRHGQQPVAGVRRRRGAQHVPEHDLDVDRHGLDAAQPGHLAAAARLRGDDLRQATDQGGALLGRRNALPSFPTTIWGWNGTTWSPGS